MPARESDPFITYSFSLDVQGVVAGMFEGVEGLGSDTEVIDVKAVDGQGKDYIQKIPGRTKFTDVTLKRGVTKLKDIWIWRKMVEDGDIVGARKNATITAYDQSGQPVATWQLRNAWPTKVSGPEFKSDSNAYGIESVGITFEYMYRE